jgi:cell division septum initiation protein DivIVA
MTKIDLYRSLQQEVEDLKNENRELKLKLAKRNKEDESSLVDLTSR